MTSRVTKIYDLEKKTLTMTITCTMQSMAASRVLGRSSTIQALPMQLENVLSLCRSNVRILHTGRSSLISISATTNALSIDNQRRFVASNLITKRNLFNAQNLDKNVTAVQSNNRSSILKTKNEPDVAESNSNSPLPGAKVEVHERTSYRHKIWGYATQYSSSFYNSVKESAQSSMNWIGGKIASSVQRNVNQMQQRVHISIETTRMNARQRIEQFRNRVLFNINEGTKSIFYNITAPFLYGWNYVANIWHTTPIWNRFFWWSLSAIAVYGIATTLPKELIKLAISPSTTTIATATETKSSNSTTPNPKDIEDKSHFKPES